MSRAGNSSGPRYFSVSGKSSIFLFSVTSAEHAGALQFACMTSARHSKTAIGASVLLVLTSVSHSECVSISEAKNHIGEIRCVSGKVERVARGNGGVHYLDFCGDYRICPFTAVIFPRDLKS